MNAMKKFDPKVIVALDVKNMQEMMLLIEYLSPQHCRVKVGMELFTAEGPACVEGLRRAGFEVFLDLKFHDIPNTAKGAVSSACNLDLWMLNIHCLGGEKMMAAAVEVVKKVSNPPKLIGVTALTSHDLASLHTLGFSVDSVEQLVHNLVFYAERNGLDGVVCSAQEVAMIRKKFRKGLLLVTPGIRPAEDTSIDDQARIVTPRGAIESGSDYLVIGRPITKAANPTEALHLINQEILSADCGQPM